MFRLQRVLISRYDKLRSLHVTEIRHSRISHPQPLMNIIKPPPTQPERQVSASGNPSDERLSLKSYQSPFYQSISRNPIPLTPDPIANAASAFHPHVIRAYREYKSLRSSEDYARDRDIEALYKSTQCVLLHMSTRMHKYRYGAYLQNYATRVSFLSKIKNRLNRV